MLKRRWMRAALAEATATRTHLPWARGLRRQAMIARRQKDHPEPIRRRA
ncbi:MAG: hypothetical protein H3C51_11880 [Rubellimicrobium sp.]|nr:hypothetical protein [Rubellimicrobium sp.]